MADPWQVASFAIETIGKLLADEGRFLAGVEGQVKLLQGELRLMQANLRDAEQRDIESQVVQVWISDVKDIAYDVEDLVERYAFRVGSQQDGVFVKYLNRCAPIFVGCNDRHNIGLEIEPLKERISALGQHFLSYGIQAKMEKGSSSVQQRLRRTNSFVQENDFVGLQDDVDKLVEHLVSPCYRVVSIWGMGGLGKTTIAKKVYKHSTVKGHFNGLVWICVSQQWEPNDIVRRILIKLLPEKGKEIKTEWSDDELFRNLHQILQQKRCLIVLDDIWTADAWNCIKDAFLTEKNGSKIMVTTRDKKVASCIAPDGFHHKPRVLDNDECWELLRRKSLPQRFNEGHDGMNEFEILGKKMVKHCAGLPLAVIVLGGILLSKPTLGEWERVHQNIKFYLWKGGVKSILDLSYYELPYHLKPCFLYLGLFPEDTDIDADTIYQLWMAEGMVLNDGVSRESIMELAEQYLAQLGQRSMVQLQMSELPGMTRRIKTCRLHDLMRELCLLEVKQDGFLTFINQERGTNPFSSQSATSSSSKYRRLVINLDDDGDLSNYIPLEKDITKSLRMFQFEVKSAHHDDKFDCISNMIASFQPISNMIASQLNKFEMLRVLRFKGRYGKDYGRLPKAIGKLIHLRYLSLEDFAFSKLPSSLGNLRHLQTLNMDSSSVASFPNILWKMKGLTCLYLPAWFGSKQCSIRLDGLNMLEILCGFDDDVCETKDLLELVNLRHLGAWCKNLDNLIMISNFVESNRRLEFVDIRTTCDFCTDREKGFTALKRLLFGRGVHTFESTGPMWKFPEWESGMASSLVNLFFYDCGLDIEDLCRTTQQFPHLNYLYIREARGKELCFGANGFPKLEELHLYDLSELEKWIVEEGAMPNLRYLGLSCFEGASRWFMLG